MSDSPNQTSRIYQQICFLISTERLASGERLGTERELSTRLEVSRAQLRQALELLEAEGRIKRLIGRGGGIFVSDGKIERELNWIVSVPTFLRQQGFASSTRVLYARLAISGADEARVLGLPDGSPIFEIKRVRFANDIPLSVEVARLPSQMFPKLLDADLTGSLYRVITHEYGHRLSRADEYIDARVATADEAELLGIEANAVVFEFRRLTSDSEGTVVEWAHDVFRADRMRVAAHATDNAPNARVTDPIKRSTQRRN